MIGLHTGMRRDSILRLRVEDIDLLQRVIWVDRDKAGERQQPMTVELAEYIGREVAVREVPSAWLFPSSASRNGHIVNIYKAFRRVVAAAGLSAAITPHTLRHTMATNAAHAGVDAATLQAVGGWKTRRMVERYTHASSLQSAMDTLQRAYRGEGRASVGTTPNLPLEMPELLRAQALAADSVSIENPRVGGSIPSPVTIESTG
jgi:integrase